MISVFVVLARSQLYLYMVFPICFFFLKFFLRLFLVLGVIERRALPETFSGNFPPVRELGHFFITHVNEEF